ncbi:MAG: MBL fold metallo-hydrolase [Verrucomicrobia bacterium]|nr:MBL fold metallo-hydrolase [Verrucomicrobiota bacterium]
MLEIQSFIGGIFETNGYLARAPGGDLLVDAPAGTEAWLDRHQRRPALLLVTHGHVDHIEDAGRVVRRYGCGLACHRDSVPMLTDPGFFRRFGFDLETEPVEPTLLIEEGESVALLDLDFRVMLVPGHCPGSLCFYHAPSGNLFSGDALFAGSIGRTDLPGGDYAQLIQGLRTKVLTLPDETRVLPGHGPPTTIGEERRTNPFLAE